MSTAALTGFPLNSYTIADTVAARDAIPAPYVGQRVRVGASTRVYEYDGAVWLLAGRAPLASAVRTLHVDPGAGDDDADGLTEGVTDLDSVQEAVNRFVTPTGGVPFWAIGDDRIIRVHGAGTFEESIAIPLHAGLGALRIIGDETIVHSGLVTSGAPFSALAGFEVRQRLSFTTSPMTPGALADNAFIRPRVNNLGNVFEFGFSMLPIVDNAAGTVDVVALDPNSLTTFIDPGDVVDAVRPDRVWQPAAGDPAAFFPTSVILNMGGALVVEGFEFRTNDVGGNSNLLEAVGPVGDNAGGSRVMFMRSIFKPHPMTGSSFVNLIIGDVVGLNGCFIDVGFTARPTRAGKGVSFGNLRMLTTGAVFIEGVDVGAFGIDIDGGALIFERSTGFAYVDSRNGGAFGGVVATKQSFLNFVALSIEGSTAAAAFAVTEHSSGALFGARVSGATGNTGVGANVNRHSSLLGSSMAAGSLTGTGGDVKVGGSAARLWTAGSETDTVELSRLIA